MAEDKYNLKNPAVKRILQEVKEMQSNPSDDFMSLPLEENIFEWQFAIRGPRDSEFEGGIYHGRIQLPAEYPFKPPSFMLLTPNGRFETQTKICLSISNHHPEHWQPSWSVRTALVALIAFMPTSPNGALGSLDYKKEERHGLAIKSREAPPKFGNPERQKLIDEIHEYMLSKAPAVPQLSPSQASEDQPTDKDGEAQANQQDPATVIAGNGLPNQTVDERVVEEEPVAPANANPVPVDMRLVREIPACGPSIQPLQRPEMRVQRSADDRLFTWAAVGLTIAILVLLFKKFMKSSGHGAVFMDGS
ncbi:ubiquitin-conjugating enzyme E2 32-like [Durio zibethinus]|uniref:Ubiquitin-conjugating enzyme E2 32-like n=1 Tax=Durio zibethinus TaxID=66656 RepID=A0A6P6A787_DURZI|nr:ubiquitin-conjugating enzyme E2 32-like [Durio zibethinus]